MFLYLKEKEFVNSWINGGIIPLYPASNYRSLERRGVLTPDENIQLKITGDDIKENFRKTFDSVINNSGKGTINFKGNVYNDEVPVGKNIDYTQSYEDYLVLCFSNNLSIDILNKLSKKAVVEIKNLNSLKSIIDSQIGIISHAGFCKYTESHNRNHFLKHIEDSWQEEYRFVWLGIEVPKNITLPKGIATEVTNDLVI